MKRFLLAVSLLVLPAAVLLVSPTFAQVNLTGHWQSTFVTEDGNKRETSLWLKADGTLLTGYLSRGDEPPSPISDAKVMDGAVSFAIVTDNFGETRTAKYVGQLNGNVLVLTMPSNGTQIRQLTFQQISAVAPPPLPVPTPKISLPAAQPVPQNGLAKTPPMGWNSWNKFAGRVSDRLVRETADAMASNGMKEAGYMYVNIDDTWEAGRDAKGNIQTNDRFPDMKALADYVHSKGLKIGIYSSPGPKTCANFEGSFNHEEQDAKQYAAWGFDLLKYDWCSGSRVYDYHSMQAVYAKMGQALLHSGRPIFYSLCQYGVLKGAQWGAQVGGNSWRTTGDIRDAWDSMAHIGFDLNVDLTSYAGPGHWNDPDMLEVGNGGMTDAEYRTHMSLWSMLAAPLLAGNDLRHMDQKTRDILLNKEVIAIDQDALGKSATRSSKNGDLEVWSRPLADGGRAVGLFNRGSSSSRVVARWSDLAVSGTMKVRDLWSHSGLSDATDQVSADVPSHGVVLLKLTPSTHR